MLNKALINLSNKNAVLKETMTTESSNAQLARGDMKLGFCILCLHPLRQYSPVVGTLIQSLKGEPQFHQ